MAARRRLPEGVGATYAMKEAISTLENVVCIAAAPVDHDAAACDCIRVVRRTATGKLLGEHIQQRPPDPALLDKRFNHIPVGTDNAAPWGRRK